ncbi:MAG TPA: 3-dehydro-L-gulonate 2-dehydrogenase [Vicinamibacterales bacterium]
MTTRESRIVRLPFDAIADRLTQVLLREGFTDERARRCATIFTETHRDGVASHGLNRFPRFVRQIRSGVVDVHAEPVCVAALGAWEQWDGRLGPGVLNAGIATDRAIELARQHGLGLVALRNTNHWMRGGTYGWQAVRAGFAFIGWTNTTPNMPPWGTVTAKLGNNPLIIAVPDERTPVVLDVAMSQFSYGRMEVLRLRGGRLPVPGGYGREGRLTDDPGAILDAQRPLPIGYWKGSGLALLLDLLAAVLAGGRTTHEIGRERDELGLSQVFLAIDVARPAGSDAVSRVVRAVIDDLHTAEPAADGGPARYPGEQVLRTREANRRDGIPVDEAVWREILALLDQL